MCAVDEVVEHWPARCDCGHVFCEQERDPVGEPVSTRSKSYPTDSEGDRAPCAAPLLPALWSRTRARLVGELTASSFGPRLQAALVALSVRNRVSRRDVVELGEELFGARLSTGSVDAILARAGEALEEPYEDLRHQVRDAPAINADETGWRTAGERRALWGLFTQRHAFFQVARDRHEDHAKSLLADTQQSSLLIAGGHIEPAFRRRQLCWSHLKRDFASHAEGLAAEKQFGEHGLELSRESSAPGRPTSTPMTGTSSSARSPSCSAPMSRSSAATPPSEHVTNAAAAWPATCSRPGPRSGHSRTHDGVQPTNNHAERALRGAVIYRKLSLGTQSPGGERRIERLLSAHTTCRLQNRSLFDYLAELLTAHARGDPAPLLA